MAKHKQVLHPLGNKTGVMRKIQEALETLRGADRGKPSSRGGDERMKQVNRDYIRESEAVGTLPPARDMQDMIKAVRKQSGQAQEAQILKFVDKLGERLAFERSGVRLYEALINKVEASGDADAPPLEELKHLRDDEFHHFEMLSELCIALGGDPTLETPCANVSGVASQGLSKVLTDPRTTVPQCLSAILIAELADNDEWQTLVLLAESLGLQKAAEKFHEAIKEEEDHLAKVRGWVAAAATGETEEKKRAA